MKKISKFSISLLIMTIISLYCTVNATNSLVLSTPEENLTFSGDTNTAPINTNTSINTNDIGIISDNTIEDNIANNNTTNTTTNTSYNNTTTNLNGGYTPSTQVSNLSTIPESSLGLQNILNILLITVGVVLILLAIAILIRLRNSQ